MKKQYVFDADINDKKSTDIADILSPSALTTDFKSTAKKIEVENQYTYIVPKLKLSMIQDS